jgi:hypothetical protein
MVIASGASLLLGLANAESPPKLLGSSDDMLLKQFTLLGAEIGPSAAFAAGNAAMAIRLGDGVDVFRAARALDLDAAIIDNPHGRSLRSVEPSLFGANAFTVRPAL